MDAIVYDSLRTKELENRGYRVLRIWNHEVFKNIQGVMDHILNLLNGNPLKHPHPSLRDTFSRKAGEGNFKNLRWDSREHYILSFSRLGSIVLLLFCLNVMMIFGKDNFW